MRDLRNALAARVPWRLRDLVRPPVGSTGRRSLQLSFSQTGEDRIVRFLFGQLGIPTPSYLDIGAYHPYELSNTALFYLGGSRGINVEPNPDVYALFRRERPRDVNLNIGCAAAGGSLTFHRFDVPTLNTFSATSAADTERVSGGRDLVRDRVPIEIRTVPDILKQHWNDRCPDFLSLDAEGMDLEILRTLPEWPALPIVICTETAIYAPQLHLGQRTFEARELLGRFGFEPFADTFLNTIFVRRDVFTG